MMHKLPQSIVFLIAAALVLALTVDGQKLPSEKKECGTVISETQKSVEFERAQNGFYTPLAPQLNRPLWIPLKIHIVRQSDGSGGLSLAQLQVAMQFLNILFSQVGMQFYQYGDVDYINSDRHYNIPNNQARRDELRQVNPVAKTINVYFTEELEGLCGQSTFTSDPIQGVLMDNECAGSDAHPTTFAHEIGHYFDLYHTHQTDFGVECPSGSNCSTAGDRLCDTPADPELNFGNNVDASCVWTGTATTPMGCDATPYNPPTRNLMSYSRRTCRSFLTANQNSKTLNVLILDTRRNDLYQNISKYVAPDGSLSSGCGYTVPCRTFQRAVEVSNPGDHIFLLGGSYQIVPVNKLIFVRKWNTDTGDALLVP